MTILEKAFTITLILALILLPLSLLFLFLMLSNGSKIKKLKNIRTKNKKKRSRNKRQIAELMRKKKKNRLFFVLFFVFSIIIGMGAAYISYYQSVNLSEEDSKAVSQAYYLLNDYQKQIALSSDKKIDQTRSLQNLQRLSSSMTNYNALTASKLNTPDGQLLLNRYYNSVKQIGVNTMSQVSEFYGNKALGDEFIKDVKKAEHYQKAVFEYYKVNEAELAKKL